MGSANQQLNMQRHSVHKTSMMIRTARLLPKYQGFDQNFVYWKIRDLSHHRTTRHKPECEMLDSFRSICAQACQAPIQMSARRFSCPQAEQGRGEFSRRCSVRRCHEKTYSCSCQTLRKQTASSDFSEAGCCAGTSGSKTGPRGCTR